MKHLRENNETYTSHFCFAAKIGVSYILSGVWFLFHAALPFIPIPEQSNLATMKDRTNEWADYADKRVTK